MHGDEDVDAAAVAECHHQAGTAEIGEVGPHPFALDDAADRGMAAGLPRDAADMNEPAGEWISAMQHRLHRDEHRRYVGLLLTRALAEHDFAGQAEGAPSTTSPA